MRRCCFDPIIFSSHFIRTFVAVAMVSLACMGCDQSSSANTAPTPSFRPTTTRPVSAVANTQATELASEAGDPDYGHALYAQSCIACHGASGQGMPRQGVELRKSRFVASQSDENLIAFLRAGRPVNDPANISKLLMPPRGGDATLSDKGLRHVVAFLRQLQQDAADDVESSTALEVNHP
jgi:cytochrome c5